MELYTVGYGAIKHIADLATVVKSRNLQLIDVRLSPRSRNPVWAGKNVAEVFGDHYTHIQDWGNLNYRGGPIKIKNIDQGHTALLNALKGRDGAVLMCMCASHGKCHRTTVSDWLCRQHAACPTHWTGSDVEAIARQIRGDATQMTLW